MNPSIRRLIKAGYQPAEPTRRKIRELTDTGIRLKWIADTTGIPILAIIRCANGDQKWIHPDHANIIAALTADQLRRTVDDDVVEQLLDGRDVSIPYGHKKMYARALHARGWNHHRIARTLAMSWTATRQALEEVAA
ncbi:hypothetical protein [Nocardia africana]